MRDSAVKILAAFLDHGVGLGGNPSTKNARLAGTPGKAIVALWLGPP